MRPIYFFVFIMLVVGAVGCYKEDNTQFLENSFFSADVDSLHYYDYIKESDKQLTYTEDFNDEDTDWWAGQDGEFSAGIRFGEYQLEINDRDILHWLSAPLSIDTDRDFDLEATIRVNNSTDDDGGGLGLSDAEGNLITLIANHQNEVSINKWDADQSKLTRPLDWEKKYWIDSFHGTTLTIRKLNSQYIFFADKKYIGVSLAEHDLIASRMVFYLKGDVEMYVNTVSLHYIIE